MAAIESPNSMTPDNASEAISLSRRRFLGSSLAGLAAGHHFTRCHCRNGGDRTRRITTDDDIERLLPQLSNWGRWGKDVQLGTLNYITPQTRLRAVALIKTGQAIPLGREVSPVNTKGLRNPKYELHRYEDPLPEEAGCIDYIGMIYHGFAVTHIDALCHIFTPEGKNGMYNGFPISEVTAEGANRLGIEHAGRHASRDVACSWMWRRSRAVRWHRDRSLRPTTLKPPNGPRPWPPAKETFCSFATAPGQPNSSSWAPDFIPIASPGCMSAGSLS